MNDNIHILNHPLLQHKLTILRNEETSTKDFRELVSEIAMIILQLSPKIPRRGSGLLESPEASVKSALLRTLCTLRSEVPPSAGSSVLSCRTSESPRALRAGTTSTAERWQASVVMPARDEAAAAGGAHVRRPRAVHHLRQDL